ncbi:MAG TPA: ABC transporter permease, partial [Pyrinomonadaceae bacterium]
QYPDSNTDYGMGLTLLPDRLVGEMRSSLLLLSVAVGLVLLVACANVANLSLARGATRAKEIAVRAALGAGRWRIIRQLLTESVLLALAGGALGLLLAVWGVDLLVSLSPDTLPRLKESTVDLRALGFTFGVSLLTGVLFGLAPALMISRADLNEALKEGGRGAGTGGGQRLRALLVVAEMALALVLSVGAGLLVKSFVRLTNVETGFSANHVLTMQLALTRARYPKEEQRTEFFRQLLDRVKAVPGVQTAGTISELPLSGQEQDTFFTIEGHAPAAPGSGDVTANNRVVSPDYFRAMNIPLIRGRFFDDRDRAGAANAVLISETFARRFFAPNEDPIGKHLTIDFGQPWQGEIVGIVGNIRHTSLAQEPFREMYTSSWQTVPVSVNLVVQTNGDPAQLTAAVKQQVQALDKDLPLYNVKTMTERVREAAAQPRFRTLLLGLFAALAVVLASVGIYGVMAYTVTQRTHEIGIRMALGAQTRDIVRLVVRQGMALGLAGLALGLVAAFALTRLLATLLYGVKATDLTVFAGTALLLALVALLACYIPARRATKVDPMIALRYE